MSLASSQEEAKVTCTFRCLAVWLTMTAFALLAGAKLGVLKPISEFAPQYSFQSLISKLNSGEIVQGTSAVGLLSKSFDCTTKSDTAGRSFEVLTFIDSKQLLKIYLHDTQIYAASLTQRTSPPFGEVWFFCDFELMRQHVTLLLKSSERDTPPKTTAK